MDRKNQLAKAFSKPSTSKMNIWQMVDINGEMEAPSLHQQENKLEIEGVTVYDQKELEKGMMAQMDEAFNQRQKTMEEKRAAREIKLVQADMKEVRFSIAQADRTLDIVKFQNNNKDVQKRLESVKRQKANKENQLKSLQAKLKRLQKVAGLLLEGDDDISTDVPENIDQATSSTVSWALTGQDQEERERLIKLGLMTPFGSLTDEPSKSDEKPQKKKLFLDDGFNDFLTSQTKPEKKSGKTKTRTVVKQEHKKLNEKFKIPKKSQNGLKSWLKNTATNDDKIKQKKQKSPEQNNNDETSPEQIQEELLMMSGGSDEEYVPDKDEISWMKQDDKEDQEMMEDEVSVGKRTKKPKYDSETGLPIFDYSDEESGSSKSKKMKLRKGSLRVSDDGKVHNFKERIAKYRHLLDQEATLGVEIPEDKELGNGLKVPGRIWSKLYKYQRTGVRWLYELHSQKVGGILGDEMGLGKTIQVISFLAALQQSGLRSRTVAGHGYDGLGPVLIITPTTLMHQWVKEFHKWWPPIRVAILHDSGNFDSSRAQLVDNIAQNRGVLITSYERARINVEMLLERAWHYVILDEGHKIRNPEAAVTTALKLFPTPHRLILSGSPVQNNLRELWSLFDFIFPGKLGTLPVFMEQFSIPIVQGGYSNATEIQVHTAYKCACKLRDTISPYLLRRMKRDVQVSIDLPEKNEQVLFCRLTEHQVDVYKKYLDSDAVHSILTREMKVFAGLIQLRKMCNHPDLYTGGPKIMVGEATPSPHNERSFGYYKRSGKMLVVASLLKIWKKQGHKVLLFTQSKAMLDIIEIFVASRGYSYLTMHGGTQVQSRQPMIKRFNEDSDIFLFVLTTRVGGLGVNLTGANRVVLYDPDWNPSTDSQAQERAWRIGQRRDVTIYRLLTSGTIEEKIYHRQIFKQFLTNRILKDPWQRRFFKSNDLHELFLLKDYGDTESDKSKGDDKEGCKTETAAIFAGIGSEVRPNNLKRKKSSKRNGDFPKKNSSEIMSKYVKNSNESSGPICEKNANNRIFDVKSVRESNSKNSEKSLHKLPEVSSSLSSSVTADKVDAKGDAPTEISSSEPERSQMCDVTSRTSHTTTTSNITENCEILQEMNETDNNKSFIEPSNGRSDIPLVKNDSSLIKDDESSGSKKTTSSFKESLMRAKLKFEEKRKAEELAKSKKSKKKKKKKRQTVIDGEGVENLASIEDYKPQKSSAEELEEKSRKATDDYVLHRLFKRAGVHSALQHNTIMDSVHPDYALVEVEAERVAKESVRNLRLSRRQYQYPTGRQSPSTTKLRFGRKSASVSKRTPEKDDSAVIKAEKQKDKIFKASHIKNAKTDSKDDGESGSEDDSSGSDSPTPLSASQLLSSMRRRNHEEIHKQEENDSTRVEEEHQIFGFSLSQPEGEFSGCTANPTEHDELMTELRDFIAFQCEVDGQARTSEIMSEFGDKVDPAHAAVFKSILKQLCTSEDSRDTNEKIWYLRPDFR